MADKYYAVRIGRHPGVYTSWDACSAEVKGFSGAEYKSFRTRAEALDFVRGAEGPAVPEDDLLAEAWVDGSYNAETAVYGWGAHVLCGGETFELSGSDWDPDMASMRNVAGEITASERVISWAAGRGIETLVIYHDYEGIAKWCSGEWKTNKAGTIAYKAFYDEMKDRLNIRFVKVKGHSGNAGNERADKLAKIAAGIELSPPPKAEKAAAGPAPDEEPEGKQEEKR